MYMYDELYSVFFVFDRTTTVLVLLCQAWQHTVYAYVHVPKVCMYCIGTVLWDQKERNSSSKIAFTFVIL